MVSTNILNLIIASTFCVTATAKPFLFARANENIANLNHSSTLSSPCGPSTTFIPTTTLISSSSLILPTASCTYRPVASPTARSEISQYWISFYDNVNVESANTYIRNFVDLKSICLYTNGTQLASDVSYGKTSCNTSTPSYLNCSSNEYIVNFVFPSHNASETFHTCKAYLDLSYNISLVSNIKGFFFVNSTLC